MKLKKRHKVIPKPIFPFLTKTIYSFPEWPDKDISCCGEVDWKYQPRKKKTKV